MIFHEYFKIKLKETFTMIILLKKELLIIKIYKGEKFMIFPCKNLFSHNNNKISA